MIKRCCLALALLAGCQDQPSPSPSPVAVAPVASATAEATPTATPGQVGEDNQAKSLDEIIQTVRDQSVDGLTNQARADLLLAHLLAAGKDRLLVTWEIYPMGPELFDVTCTIEPMSRLTRPDPSATPAKRTSPFDPIPKRKTKGVRLTWSCDTSKATCQPADDRTRALLALKPSLEASGLEQVLPTAWRSKPAAEVPTLVSPATATPEVPGEEPAEEPIEITGFIGEGRERRVALSQAGQTYTLGPGEKLGEVTVKAVEEDRVVLEFRGGSYPIEAGKKWVPGQF